MQTKSEDDIKTELAVHQWQLNETTIVNRKDGFVSKTHTIPFTVTIASMVFIIRNLILQPLLKLDDEYTKSLWFL